MPERLPGTNIWSVLENEFFVDVMTNKQVKGPLIVRILETGIGELVVQGNEQRYTVLGDVLEDFDKSVREITS